MSYQVELMGIALGLYLYDCSVFLYSNEGLMTCDQRGRWAALTGWLGFVLAGRTLCILNPFTPYRASFRLAWSLESSGTDEQDHSWSDRVSGFAAIAPLTISAGVGLFLILPFGLFTALGVYALASAALLIYGSTVAALFLMYRTQPFQGKLRSFASFAFECLACPPFAVNMVRRLTLAAPIAESFPRAARRLVPNDEWVRVQVHCVAKLEESMQVLDPASTAYSRAAQRIEELNGMSAR